MNLESTLCNLPVTNTNVLLYHQKYIGLVFFLYEVYSYYPPSQYFIHLNLCLEYLKTRPNNIGDSDFRDCFESRYII